VLTKKRRVGRLCTVGTPEASIRAPVSARPLGCSAGGPLHGSRVGCGGLCDAQQSSGAETPLTCLPLTVGTPPWVAFHESIGMEREA